jgi:lipopolysaccharide export system permease protein
MITLRNNESEPTKIEAAEATLKYSVKDDALILRLTNGNASVGGQASFRFPDTFVHTVSLMKGHEYDLLTANPSHMPMSDLHPATMKQTTEIRKLQSAVAVNAGLNVLTSRFDSIASPSAGNRIARATQGSQRLHRLMAESNRRWASGFTCLALAMVGIPLAIHLKTADVMTTFGIVFLPTLIIYYPIFALTLDMAKDGRLPPWAVWSASGVFLGIGAIMMRKTVHL